MYILQAINVMAADVPVTLSGHQRHKINSRGSTAAPGVDIHDDVIKWKHFPCYWPFVRGIHRSPVNSPHKGQWRGALMYSFNQRPNKLWVNSREAGDLRHIRPQYNVRVMATIGRVSAAIILTRPYGHDISSHDNNMVTLAGNQQLWFWPDHVAKASQILILTW